MGLLAKLLQKTNKEKQVTVEMNPQCQKIMEIGMWENSLLLCDHYVARSEFQTQWNEYHKDIEFIEKIVDNDLLDSFCEKNGVQPEMIRTTLNQYKNFFELIEIRNDQFVVSQMKKEKDYLDTILKDVDPNIQLDEDQRKVVLTDEDYCLVIAGAGAGKTTTVAAKIKYLVDKKNIDPKQILVVSFTNKAVNELRDKINQDLGIDCPISTFHSVGNAIIHKQSDEKLNIVESSKLYYVLQDYFKEQVLTNEKMVDNLVLFFSSYLNAPYEGDDLKEFFNKIAKGHYTSLRSDIENYKNEIIDANTKKLQTIQNEWLRSMQEVEIANFLYLNGIDYQYEPIYPYSITKSRKPYTPDFLIKQGNKQCYLEHFGITQDGENPRYDAVQLEKYKKSINEKILLHRKHNTPLIYTFSSYRDYRSLREHLQDELIKAGFELKPRDNEEVLKQIIQSEESKYIQRLVQLVIRFIHNFKTNGYTEKDFEQLRLRTNNVRNLLFLDIAKECYLEYQRYLNMNHAVDFEDMINNSTRILREVEEVGKKLDFKYIIIDEYQDISHQRFDLAESFSKVTNAKIVAVGDDWQSIYAFSGSDITLFTKFSQTVGYAKELKIVKTYRNSQEVIDIAGTFIQKNTEQIRKTLKSVKNIDDPVIIYTYDGARKKPNEDRKSGADYAMAEAVQKCLGEIDKYNRKAGKDKKSSVLLLGRYGFDGDKLQNSGLFQYQSRGDNNLKSVKYPYMKITFMTAHASKGLGYDNVVVVNGKNEMYGFPSKIEDDPVLSLVMKVDRSYDYAEERRLFYVAMTRTKNRVFFVAPEQNPSEFLLELKRDFKTVSLKGEWNEAEPEEKGRKYCPICGYPLQYRYKASYGLRLYLCTNEPEMCDFMTNNVAGEKLSIMKCTDCDSGYLIVKPDRNQGFFLGCTNYHKDGTGCSKVISKQLYYSMNNYKEDEAVIPLVKPKAHIKPVEQNNLTEAEEINDDIPVAQAKDMKPVEWKGQDLYKVTCLVVDCLSDMSRDQNYGISRLIEVLIGSNTKQIMEKGLYELEQYGSLSRMKKDDLRVIIQWMINKKYVFKTKGLYPVLFLTAEGYQYKQIVTRRMLIALRMKLEAPRDTEIEESK